jgi:hypothetical protein
LHVNGEVLDGVFFLGLLGSTDTKIKLGNSPNKIGPTATSQTKPSHSKQPKYLKVSSLMGFFQKFPQFTRNVNNLELFNLQSDKP